MIWLDGLDLPQFQHFPVHFVQHYSQSRYPAQDTPQGPIIYPWSEVQPKLDTAEGPHAIMRYASKMSRMEGEEVSKTIGAQCERLDEGASSQTIQETTSAVYHVIDGEGHSKIGETEIQWTKGDTFVVPSWQPYSHHVGRR